MNLQALNFDNPITFLVVTLVFIMMAELGVLAVQAHRMSTHGTLAVKPDHPRLGWNARVRTPLKSRNGQRVPRIKPRRPLFSR